MLRADGMDELGLTAIGHDGLRVIDRERRHGRGRGPRRRLRSNARAAFPLAPGAAKRLVVAIV
jgi:hypothetical protein